MSTYSFDIFAQSGVEPRGDAVVFGISSGLLSTTAVADFEEWMISNRGIDGSYELLLFDGTRAEAVAVLERAGYHDDGDGESMLRYVILASLDSTGQQLLLDIESVYSDFDYPQDMEPFVYYMPSEGVHNTPEHLAEIFKNFMDSEKNRLGL